MQFVGVWLLVTLRVSSLPFGCCMGGCDGEQSFRVVSGAPVGGAAPVVLWSTANGGGAAGCASNGGLAVCPLADGTLIGLNASGGAVFALQARGASVPLVTAASLLIVSTPETVALYDAANRSTAWTSVLFPRPLGDVYGPTLSGNDVLVWAWAEGRLVGFLPSGVPFGVLPLNGSAPGGGPQGVYSPVCTPPVLAGGTRMYVWTEFVGPARGDGSAWCALLAVDARPRIVDRLALAWTAGVPCAGARGAGGAALAGPLVLAAAAAPGSAGGLLTAFRDGGTGARIEWTRQLETRTTQVALRAGSLRALAVDARAAVVYEVDLATGALVRTLSVANATGRAAVVLSADVLVVSGAAECDDYVLVGGTDGGAGGFVAAINATSWAALWVLPITGHPQGQLAVLNGTRGDTVVVSTSGGVFAIGRSA